MAQDFGLGRGLSSLIPQKTSGDTPHAKVQKAEGAQSDGPQESLSSHTATEGQLRNVKVRDINANPHQPRTTFDEDKLADLTASIAEHGVLQPLVVTQRADGGYELIAGERRFRAAKMAGCEMVPVIIRDASEQQKMELAIIENVQRHDLNVIEEAKAYQRLAHTYGLSQEEVAHRIGKSRSVVANRLRLLTLPVTILKALRDGTISEGHAKVILSIDGVQNQQAFFAVIVRERLTVRQAEARAKKVLGVTPSPHHRASLPAVETAQKALTDALSTRVKVMPRGRGGKVVIDYYAPEDLRVLVERVCRKDSLDAQE